MAASIAWIVVAQAQPLSMGWCLDCHRAPESHLRPKDEITNMDWKPGRDRSRQDLGPELEGRVQDSRRRLHDELLHVSPMNDQSTSRRQGAEYWRSLEHLADAPEMRELIGKEFPGYDADEMLSPLRGGTS